MFLDHYHLSGQPFDPALQPPIAYASHAHCEALKSSRSSILADCGNLAILAGTGVGKSTLLHELLQNLRDTGRITHLFQRACNSREILQFVLAGLGVDCTQTECTVLKAKLNEIWFAEMLAGKRFVLLFDDADQLSDDALETLRLLSKYETPSTKLLQIVFCGQPKFLLNLERENLAQLHKSIVRIIPLELLSPVETAGYIRHRLDGAGFRGEPLFNPEAIAVVADLSRGIPSHINTICSRALREAYARGLRFISSDIVEKAERNLNSTNASVAMVMPLAQSSEAVRTVVTEPALRTAVSQITYRVPKQLGLPRSGVWIGAVAAVLLSAGLALPHGMLKGVTQIMRGSITTTASASPYEATSQRFSNPVPASTTAPIQSVVLVGTTMNVDSAKLEPPQVLPDAPIDQRDQLSLTRELGLKISRIVIDPGHGGFDTGAKGPHGLLEKDVCLDVALRLGQIIEENIPGAQIVYTRKDDSYVPLEERTAVANSADADLFISIHANSSDISEVRGVETYYLSLATTKEAKELAIRENAFTQSSMHDLPNLVKKITQNERVAESKILAAEIQDTLSQRLQLVSRHEKNRGVKQAPFIVLTGANMPAVLSEISFVSNASDETLLLGNGQRQRIADGLYRGIASYLDGLHGIAQNKQKLITENRAATPAVFEHSLANTGRNPL